VVVALLNFAAGGMQVEVGRQQRLVRSARSRPCWATFLVLDVNGKLALVVSVDLVRYIRWVWFHLSAFCV
jgi:hypothetical protein